MTKSMILLSLALAGGCVSTGKTVVDRSEGMTERPTWSLDNAEIKQSGGKFTTVGAASMEGGANQVACLHAAELDAKAQLAKQLFSRVEGLSQAFQSVQGTDFEETLRNVFSVNLKDAAISGRYFERVVTTLPDESSDDKLSCFARVEITGTAYRRLLKEVADTSKEAAIRDAMRKESERFFSSDQPQAAH